MCVELKSAESDRSSPLWQQNTGRRETPSCFWEWGGLRAHKTKMLRGSVDFRGSLDSPGGSKVNFVTGKRSRIFSKSDRAKVFLYPSFGSDVEVVGEEVVVGGCGGSEVVVGVWSFGFLVGVVAVGGFVVGRVDGGGGSHAGNGGSAGVAGLALCVEFVGDLAGELVGELGIVGDDALHGVTSLTELGAVVREPGSGFLDDAVFYGHVDDLSRLRDAFAEHDLELGFHEGGRDFVFHYFDFGDASDCLVSFLDEGGGADLQAH